MKPKSYIKLEKSNFPIILKFNDKEYIINATSKDSLYMTKNKESIDKIENMTYNTGVAKDNTILGEVK